MLEAWLNIPYFVCKLLRSRILPLFVLLGISLIALTSVPSVLAVGVGTIETVDLYTCDQDQTNGEIHKINESTGAIISSQTIVISGIPASDTHDLCLALATDPTDFQMYMISKSTVGNDRNLVTIDPTTGSGAFVGQLLQGTPTPEDLIQQIFFDMDGQMYGVDSNDGQVPQAVFALNKATGVGGADLCTMVGSAGQNGLALNYDTGTIYRMSPDFFLDEMDFSETTCNGFQNLAVTGLSYTKQQGFIYDTVTRKFIIHANTVDPQDFFSLDFFGVVGNIGSQSDEKQRTMAYTLQSKSLPAEGNILTAGLYSCDKPSVNQEIHLLNNASKAIVSSQTVSISAGSTSYQVPHNGCLGLATDPTDGQMYMISKENFGDRYLATIDPTTGTGTALGQLDFGGENLVNDIGFDSTGQMFGHSSQDSGNPNAFFEIDKSDGTTSPSICTYSTTSGFNHITLNHDTGNLYHIDDNGVNIHLGIVDTTGADSDCIISEVLQTDSDMTAITRIMGFTYDTAHQTLVLLGQSSDPQLMVQIITSPTNPAVSINATMQDGTQRGLAFALTNFISTPPDSTPPVISAITTEPIILMADQSFLFTDFVSCIDDVDGDITLTKLVIDSGSIDTSSSGIQTQSYTCEDTETNSASATIEFLIKRVNTTGGGSVGSLEGIGGVQSGLSIDVPAPLTVPIRTVTPTDEIPSEIDRIFDLFSFLDTFRLSPDDGTIQEVAPVESGLGEGVDARVAELRAEQAIVDERPNPIADFFSSLFAFFGG